MQSAVSHLHCWQFMKRYISRYCVAIGFKQYSKKKPAKYGLIYHNLCNSSVSYTYYTLPYARKPVSKDLWYFLIVRNW